MDKNQLQSILSNNYQPAFWRQILTDVFGVKRLNQQPQPILLPANEIATNALELGSFETEDGRVVGLYQIDLNDSVRIGQNRVGVRSLLRNIYKYDVDAALVVFVQNDKWRLSLISEIRILDDDGNLTDQKTEPKRFTYLLGIGETVRTAVDRLDLYRESDSELKSLIDAFSVEKLNKDFFRDYKIVFEDMVSEIGKSIKDAENARLFTQSLLNRLMFLYFIQKKGWMRFEGNENYLRSVFNKAHSGNENFYRDRLYWIFFYGLSNQAESIEIQTNEFLEERRGDVPYLNGGLFEMEKDGNDEKGKVSISNDRFAEILKLFESYNFTIDESTPFEVQIAVDPEMLGKVFEELVTGRHESGSYYTPRTVVSFMCREALKHALAECDTPEVIAELVDESNGKNVRNPEKILETLRKIRACDPACGSGAYLLGMLHELLHVREALFAAEKIAQDAQYKWKREIIENSIYGVDMDRFATQIASLRLWLSLAIESDEPKPLPNLKYKIGCGDSLLAPIETIGQTPDLHRRALIEQFIPRKKEYIDADDHLEKRDIEAEIERLRVEIARTLHHLPEPPSPAKLILARNGVEPLRGKVNDAVKRGDKASAESNQKKLDALLADISKWEAEQTVDHYDTGYTFDWSVEFAEVFEDGGFDVVLANPPYVRQEAITELKPALKKIYSTYTGTADLYVYFYERGWQLLKSGGALAFITQNKFFRAAYGENLRRFLSTKTELTQVIDFGDAPIFDATAYPCIVMCIKNEPRIDNSIQALKWRTNDTISEFASEFRNRSFPVAQVEFTDDGWRLESPEVLALLKKLRNKGTPLGEYVGGKIYRGIITGLNEAFVLNGQTRDRLVSEHPGSAEILKPFLRGRDVKRWRCSFADRYLIKIESSSNKKHPWSGKPSAEAEEIFAKTYPAIHTHLNNYREALIRRDDQGAYFWELRASAYWSEFEKAKIIYPNICKRNEFAFEENHFISNQKAYIIPGDDRSLLGILNSSVFLWLFDCLLPKLQGDFYEPNKVVIQEFPVPLSNALTASEIERLTDLVFQEKEMMDRVTALEVEIDKLVYKLYDLTDDEIAIIEGKG